ncbi:mitochondrial carrier domain-containing protein [Umbelopsis sp. PMI_123]|nr:mitochondrial carrier domain-containing protein [Umbelopsis sp. PMI_123]
MDAPSTTNVPPQTLTAMQTFKNLVQMEGISSLFKGVLSPIVGLAGLNAILFVSYGNILRFLERNNRYSSDPNHFGGPGPTLTQVFLAGCGAGFACFLLSAPTDLVKIQAQMHKGSRTSIQVAKDIFRRGGIPGFFQGGMITIIRDAPSYGVYFAVYEGLKRSLKVENGGISGENAWKLLLAGGFAGTISWGCIYPLDVIKSRMQMQVIQPTTHIPSAAFESSAQSIRFYSSTSSSSPSSTSSYHSINTPHYRSTWDCVVRSWRTEGPGVFVRGIGPTVLRAFPVNAVTFWIYEVVAAAMNNFQN